MPPAQVKLEIVEQTAQVCKALGLHMTAPSLIDTIQTLVMDNQWRVRQAVLQQIPELARLFGLEVFETKLQNLFFESLADSVAAVRSAAVYCMGEVCMVFGPEWTAAKFFPLVQRHAQSEGGEPTGHLSGFSFRATIMFAFVSISQPLSPEQCTTLILPNVVKGFSDDVSNVRQVSATAVAALFRKGKILQTAWQSTIKAPLETAMADADLDVAYHATQTHQEISAAFASA